MNSKNFVFILTAAIVLVGVWYYAAERPAPPGQYDGTPPRGSGNWKPYQESNEWFGFSLEYPPDWGVAGLEASGEAGTRVYFSPPESDRSPEASVTLLITNPRLTPALPVLYQYATVRTVQGASGEVKIQTRTPGTPGEYIAIIINGAYTAELRFGSRLNPAHASLFDRMVASFRFTPTPKS